MRVFKTAWFAKFAKRERISDLSLSEAVERAEHGVVDADLGSGLIKQRVARQGQGRSGGYRMLLAFRSKRRAVFFYGFAKNEREHIGPDELATAREIAAVWLASDAEKIARAIAEGELKELSHDNEKTR